MKAHLKDGGFDRLISSKCVIMFYSCGEEKRSQKVLTLTYCAYLTSNSFCIRSHSYNFFEYEQLCASLAIEG